VIKGISHGYSILIRGTPMMVQAMIFKYGCQALGVNWNSIAQGVQVFDGWFYAGIIVITFNTAAYMGEIVNSGLNGIDKGQLEGAASLGLSPFQTLMKVSLASGNSELDSDDRERVDRQHQGLLGPQRHRRKRALFHVGPSRE
jgi:ABC-type amino acid transport system permease subunit